VLLLALGPGCQVFHSYRPVPIKVIDAETDKPIAAADVHITYPLASSPFAPAEEEGKSGDDGYIYLRAAPYGELGIKVAGEAPGYLPATVDLSVMEVRALDPPGWFEDVERRKAKVWLCLYAGPRPSVELILPPLYRGIVKVDIQVDSTMVCPKGQRSFRFEVPPTGLLQVKAPRLLAWAMAQSFILKYPDGTVLSPSAKGPQIGAWWLRSEGKMECFFVGTEQELSYQSNDKEVRLPRGERSSGRGQGGRRGGQQSPGLQ
jgi:hypothetical protein